MRDTEIADFEYEDRVPVLRCATVPTANVRGNVPNADILQHHVVLCGAAMAGMPARIADHVTVPVIDGIAAGVGLCEMLVRLKPAKARTGSLAHPGERPTKGLSAPLAALLKGG